MYLPNFIYKNFRCDIEYSEKHTGSPTNSKTLYGWIEIPKEHVMFGKDIHEISSKFDVSIYGVGHRKSTNDWYITTVHEVDPKELFLDTDPMTIKLMKIVDQLVVMK